MKIAKLEAEIHENAERRGRSKSEFSRSLERIPKVTRS